MSQTVDVDLINAFWQAARDSMRVMGDLQVKRRRVFLKPDDRLSGRYYAVIGLSKGLTGNVAVNFPLESASLMAQALFAEATEDDDLLMDAVGELCNLTAGGGKQLLSQGGYQFEISPPTALVNRDSEEMSVSNPAGTVCIVIDCALALEGQPRSPFMIELAFQTESRDELMARKQRQGYVVPQPDRRRG